eukprot:753676-Hanusia_phi.AAC.1
MSFPDTQRSRSTSRRLTLPSRCPRCPGTRASTLGPFSRAHFYHIAESRVRAGGGARAGAGAEGWWWWWNFGGLISSRITKTHQSDGEEAGAAAAGVSVTPRPEPRRRSFIQRLLFSSDPVTPSFGSTKRYIVFNEDVEM